jgi:LmbE family N-acetylglucosaminyl deacetylase
VSELAAIDDELARAAIDGSPALVERVDRLVRAAAARGLGNAAVADIRRAETRAAAAELGVPSLVEMLLTSGG